MSLAIYLMRILLKAMAITSKAGFVQINFLTHSPLTCFLFGMHRERVELNEVQIDSFRNAKCLNKPKGKLRKGVDEITFYEYKYCDNL